LSDNNKKREGKLKNYMERLKNTILKNYQKDFDNNGIIIYKKIKNYINLN